MSKWFLVYLLTIPVSIFQLSIVFMEWKKSCAFKDPAWSLTYQEAIIFESVSKRKKIRRSTRVNTVIFDDLFFLASTKLGRVKLVWETLIFFKSRRPSTFIFLIWTLHTGRWRPYDEQQTQVMNSGDRVEPTATTPRGRWRT